MKPALTVNQLAERWGILPDAVYALINSGQLPALNVSLNPAGRPTWRIRAESVEKFEAARSTATEAAPRRRRRQQPDPVKEYV